MKELAKALARVQGEIKAASKDTVNPFFKSHYADLSAVWDVVRKPLSENGLAVVQGAEQVEGGGWALRTTLLHTSGDSISSLTPLLMAKQDAQALGSAMTYARRYSLAALIGVVADEDDDGNAAVTPKAAPVAPTPPKPQPDKKMLADLATKLGACENITQLQAAWSQVPQGLQAQLAEVKDKVKASFQEVK